MALIPCPAPRSTLEDALDAPLASPRHKSQQSHDSGTYLDWSPEEPAAGAAPGAGDFVTVVSVEGGGQMERSSPFVTVLSIGRPPPNSGSAVVHVQAPPRALPDGAEEVSVYRLPGERLGFGLKFEGGSGPGDRVRRLLIQSCAPESPASRAACSWGPLREGDEILEIDAVPVNTLTKAECVQAMKDSKVVMRCVVRRPAVVCGELKKASPGGGAPPPIPPRKGRPKTDAPPSSPSSDGIVPPSGFGDQDAGALLATDIIDEKRPLSRTSSGASSTTSAHRLAVKRASPMTPPTHRTGKQPLPPDAEVYMDLISLEMRPRSRGPDSESDDTGSSLSTVVAFPSTSNSSISASSPTTMTAPPHLDLARVLGPFERLERELASSSQPTETAFVFPDLQPPPSFQDAPLSYADEEVRLHRAFEEESPSAAAPDTPEAGKRKKRAPPPPPPPPPRGKAPPQPAPRDKLPRLVHCVPKEVALSASASEGTPVMPEPLERLIERQHLLDLVSTSKTTTPAVEVASSDSSSESEECSTLSGNQSTELEIKEVASDEVDGEITLRLPDLVMDSQDDADPKEIVEDADTECEDGDGFLFRRSMSSPLPTIGEDEEEAENIRPLPRSRSGPDAAQLQAGVQAGAQTGHIPNISVPEEDEVAAFAEELAEELQRKQGDSDSEEESEGILCEGGDFNNNLRPPGPPSEASPPDPLRGAERHGLGRERVDGGDM